MKDEPTPPAPEKQINGAFHALHWLSDEERRIMQERLTREPRLSLEVQQSEDILARLSLRTPEKTAPFAILEAAKRRVAPPRAARQILFFRDPRFAWTAAAGFALWAGVTTTQELASRHEEKKSPATSSPGASPTPVGAEEEGSPDPTERETATRLANLPKPRPILPGPDHRERIKPDLVAGGGTPGSAVDHLREIRSIIDGASFSHIIVAELRQPGANSKRQNTLPPLFDRVADAIADQGPPELAGNEPKGAPDPGVAAAEPLPADGLGTADAGLAANAAANPVGKAAEGGQAAPGLAAPVAPTPTPDANLPNNPPAIVAATPAVSPPEPLAWALVDRATGKGSIIVSGLTDPPNGQAYQLWLVDPSANQPLSAGLLPSLPDGNGQIVFEMNRPDLAPTDFLLTRESAQGALQPSKDIVLQRETPADK